MENSNQIDQNQQGELSFLDHLEELRHRIIRIVLSFFILTVLAYFFKEEIFNVLISPLQSLELEIIHTKVHDKFMAFLKISLYTGIILSFPVIIFQVSKFILPALYPSEKKWFQMSLGVVIFLFFTGAYMAYQFLAPVSLNFLITFGKDEAKQEQKIKEIKTEKSILHNDLLSINDKLGEVNKYLKKIISQESSNPKQLLEVDKKFALIYNDFNKIGLKILALNKKEKKNREIKSLLSISEYVDWILFFVFIVGVVFQLPLVITILAKFGLVTAKALGKFRPYALIIILIVSAVITPPDVFSQIMIGIPVYLLYEISIIMARIVKKREDKKMDEYEES